MPLCRPINFAKQLQHTYCVKPCPENLGNSTETPEQNALGNTETSPGGSSAILCVASIQLLLSRKQGPQHSPLYMSLTDLFQKMLGHVIQRLSCIGRALCDAPEFRFSTFHIMWIH